MRKYIIIICACLLFTIICCSICASYCLEKPDKVYFGGKEDFSDIEYGFSDKYNIDVLIDKQLAFKIGKTVFQHIYAEDFDDVFHAPHYTVSEMEINNESVFFVTVGNDGYLGGCVTVAIRKSDGAILKMWPGE